jgi:predicted ArsR family transcriptional regulator
MADEKLHQLLTQLHNQLQQQSSLDDESQKLLEQVLADVQSASGDVELHQDLSERIEQQAVQFEQAHPTLAEILRQIMDTLGRIGV